MGSGIPNSRSRGSLKFQDVAAAFLLGDGLPFAKILSAERIQRIFSKHGCAFGVRGIYNTAAMLWSFLGQVLRDGKEASCQAAVARIVSYCLQAGLPAPTKDTGDYCRARGKLSAAALRELSCEVAAEAEQAVGDESLWKKMHAKLIDGFTFTMPDTPLNQAEYPQQKAQQPGLGQPIARCAAVVSLATASVLDLAIGPYSGKETGETALLRKILPSLSPGDVAVMDRYYCSFMMIALLLAQGVQVCARKHHKRHTDFRRGMRLGKDDHLIVWARPLRPEWMDEASYARIPETLVLRELRYNIVEPGRRTQEIIIITTFTDPAEFTKEEIATLYGFRWNAELDIRSIKASLNLGHVRCKSPKMVRIELWTTILGYNLIRLTAAGAAQLHGKQPRQISFTGTCQYVLASWMQLAGGAIAAGELDEFRKTMLEQIAACEVANRPGRLEPREIKKRPGPYKLMKKPRAQRRKELRKRSA